MFTYLILGTEIDTMFGFIIVTLLITLTVLQSFKKWGWIDLYETYRFKWMPSGACNLCLSFWLSIPVAIGYYFVSAHGYAVFVTPFACAGFINSFLLLVRLISRESFAN